jgi:hypothetical protein
MNVKGLAAFLFLMLIIGSVKAVTPPSNIIVYVPFNVVNSQAVATSNPFQQLVTVNSLAYKSYEAGNLMNVEFFYPNSTVIPSWLESNNSNTSTVTNYWPSISGIGASSNELLYMGFAPIGNDLLVGGQGAGEAAQLIPGTVNNTVDNGNVIFPYYRSLANSVLRGTLSGAGFIGTTGVTVTFGTTKKPVRKFVERHSQLGLSCFSRHDSDEEDVFSSSMSRTIADRARAS